MRKGLIVLLVAVVAVAFALPAMADMNVSGFYRAKAWMSNFHDSSGAPSLRTGASNDMEQTNAYVEQRARLKMEFGTENVKAVWFLESDFTAFGDSASIPNRNQGGALSGDSIQIETKNLYLWFKLPDTSLDFTVGLQNQTDAYAGVLYGAADLAGIWVTGKYEPVKYKLGWSKLYENNVKNSDDATLYTAEVNFVPTKDATMGVNFYYLQDDTGKVTTVPTTTVGAKLNPFDNVVISGGYRLKLYTPGINGTFKAGPATLTGFAFYQWGTAEATVPANSDADIKAYGLDLRADAKLGPGNAFFEGLYLSGGDKDDEYNAPIGLGDYQTNNSGTTVSGSGGNSSYTRTRMQIMLASWDTINTAQCLVGCSSGEYGDSLGLQGRGLWHIAAGYAMDVSPKVKTEINIGYAAAVKLQTGESSWRDKSLGTEINVGANYNIMKGLDFGLYGAYMWLGDFVKAPPTTSAPSGTEIKDPWSTYARLNYAF